MLVAGQIRGLDGVEREAEAVRDSSGEAAGKLVDGPDSIEGEVPIANHPQGSFHERGQRREVHGEMLFDEIAAAGAGPHPVPGTVEHHQTHPEFTRSFVDVALAAVAAEHHEEAFPPKPDGRVTGTGGGTHPSSLFNESIFDKALPPGRIGPMKDRLFKERCLRLKLILTDVDGVMTDGSIFILPNGEEARVFNVRDGYGIVLAHAAGIETGLLTGRSSPTVTARAKALGMAVVKQGSSDKARAFDEILAEKSLAPHEVAYVGDDYPDLPVLQRVGLSAVPQDAPMALKEAAFMILDQPGGRGALREFIEAILRAREALVPALASLGIEIKD